MSFYFNASTYNYLTGGTMTADPTEYTIAAWVKPYDTNARYITCRTDSTGPSAAWTHQMYIETGVFKHYIYDGGTNFNVGTTAVVANTWYHVTITGKNSGFSYLYVNGRSEGTAQDIGTMWTGGDRWAICGPSSDGSGRAAFNGELGYLIMWYKQFSASEVLRLYNTSKISPLTLYPSSLKFYYMMNDKPEGISNSTETWKDLTGAVYAQTITGAPLGKADHLSMG